jgi:hypothetical protein
VNFLEINNSRLGNLDLMYDQRILELSKNIEKTYILYKTEWELNSSSLYVDDIF